MKNSKKSVIVLVAATIPAIIKPLNQQNATELRELIEKAGNDLTAQEVVALDAEKLSVAKTKQRLINIAASLLPEDQVFGNPEAAKNEKVNKKLEANETTLKGNEFVKGEDGNYKKGEITVTKEQAESLTVKQLNAILNPPAPKAPKVEFKGYTQEQLDGFTANVGKTVTLMMGGKEEKGVVKSHRIYTPTGRALYNVLIDGKIRSASTENKTIVFGEMAPVDTAKADAKAAAEKVKADAKAEKEKAKKDAKEAADKKKADDKAAADEKKAADKKAADEAKTTAPEATK